MPKRIAIIARNMPPLYGGGGMLARTLAISLAEHGYKITLLTDTPNPAPIPGCHIASPYSIARSGGRIKRGVRRIKEYSWLSKQINSGDFDLVYAVSAQAFTLSAVHIAHRHGIPAAFETSLYGSDDLATISRHRLGFLLRRFFLSADKIVNISPLLEQVCVSAGVPKDKLRLIPNPINEAAFRPPIPGEKLRLRTSLGLPESSIILFSAGAISFRKGHDRLARIFDRITKTHDHIYLVLAGPLNQDKDSSDLYNDISSQMEKSGIRGKVAFPGMVNNVDQWMRASDIFVFASRREGFGTVFTEAMASALPIVAYKIDGITDYIFGVNSDRYIVDDEDKFISALISLIESESERSSYANLLRNRYNSTFSLPTIMQLYENLFSELLSERT